MRGLKGGGAILLVMGSGFGGVFVRRLGTLGMDDTKRFSVDGDRVLW